MATNDIRNWLKLNILQDPACEALRKLFLKAWKEKFGREWEPEQANIDMILSSKQLKNIGAIQKKTIKSGDIYKWDLTTLRAILTSTDLLNVGKKNESKIERLVKIRNKLAHSADKIISDQDLDAHWREVTSILVEFGESETDLELLRQESRVGGVEFLKKEEPLNDENVAIASRLKKSGNSEFSKRNWNSCIQNYSEAIVLPGISAADRATLYANRSIAWLKEYKIARALDDAKKATELWPEWWRGHFRLGQVYIEMKKYKKAQECLNEANERQPQNGEVIRELSFVRMKLGQLGCIDAIDPRNVFKTTRECIIDINNRTGSHINVVRVPQIQQLSASSACPESQNRENCRRGHRCRAGLDGYPCDYELAVQYYKKAADKGSAEGLYHLALLTMEGKGIKRNIALAISLLKKAASMPPTYMGMPNLGVAEAEHSLGLNFHEGVAVEKDLHEAIIWYERACEHGSASAANNLGVIYLEMGGEAKACRYYKMAANGGDPNAMNNLAHHFANSDPEMALEWCHRAKNAGLMSPALEDVEEKCREKIAIFFESAVSKWESENGGSPRGLNLYQRVEHYLTGQDPNLAYFINQRNLASKKVNKISGTSNQMKFPPRDVAKYAKTSEYCKTLLRSQNHFFTAMASMLQLCDIRNLPLTVCEKFITELAACAKIEFLVAEFPATWYKYTCNIVNQLMTQDTTFREDICVCYAELHCTSSEETTIAFLNECIRRYPKNHYFVSTRCCLNYLLNRYEDGLFDANTAIKLDPTDHFSFYHRASTMNSLYPSVPAEATIKAYKEFLDKAPGDHRKVPDAHYGIASLELKSIQQKSQSGPLMDLVKQHFQLGIEAEKRQLPFFLPYESSTKPSVEATLMAYSLKQQATCGNPLPLDIRGANTENPPNAAQSNNSDRVYRSRLGDPYRETLTKDHRKDIAGLNNVEKAAVSIKPPKVQRTSNSLAELKDVTLQEMDHGNDKVYEGHVMMVTVIDDICFTGSSMRLIVEDTIGDVEKCAIYNWKRTANAAEAKKTFGPGCSMSIINPYMRMASDGKPVICVDDPASIVFHGFVVKMCRYCCEANASKNCIKCSANYCDKKCQKLDWARNHKLICRP